MATPVRIRWKALAPLLGVVGSWLASPQALGLVPAEWAWVLLFVSGLIAVVAPALVTNRPKTAKPPKAPKPPQPGPTDAKIQRGE